MPWSNHWRWIAAALAVAGLAAGAPGCRRADSPPPPGSVAAPAPPPAPLAKAPRLPEDPAAGRAAEEQWREHLEEEERERQMAFDAPRLKEHRTVTALFDKARSKYDGATTAGAIDRARTDVARRLADIRRQITQIDRWGNSSHLLNDYDALAKLLSSEYPDARLAAIQGNAKPLDDAAARFDGHKKAIAGWLEEVEHEEEEGRERAEGEREREENHERR